MNYLFVCSKNKWRSRTAEYIFKNNGFHEVRSAGTEASARVKLTKADLNWADIIFVMEDKHKESIKRNYSDPNIMDKIEVLGIKDNYKYLDNELIEILKVSTQGYFN